MHEGAPPAGNLHLSNLIAPPIAPLEGPGWRVDETRITTPTILPFGIMLTVIQYRERLCFNFNHKLSLVTSEQARALVTRFAEALDEVERALRDRSEAEGAA